MHAILRMSHGSSSFTLTFTETFRQGKSRTHIMKVADTNHLSMSMCLQQSLWQVRDKPVCVALMEYSPLQCTGKVCDCHKVGVMEFGFIWLLMWLHCYITAWHDQGCANCDIPQWNAEGNCLHWVRGWGKIHQGCLHFIFI